MFPLSAAQSSGDTPGAARRLQAVKGALRLLLVVIALWFGHWVVAQSPLAPSRLRQMLGRIHLPRAARLVASVSEGNSMCFDSWPSIYRWYVVPKTSPKLLGSINAQLEREGYLVESTDGAIGRLQAQSGKSRVSVYEYTTPDEWRTAAPPNGGPLRPGEVGLELSATSS